MAAKQRRWQPFPARSRLFRDCIFFVQSASRPNRDVHGDLALIQEHGGRTVSNPFGDLEPTHIVVAIKGSPADYCFALKVGYPQPLPGTHLQPDNWHLEDLVAYALERERRQNPVIIVQLPWLRECVQTGFVLDAREDYAGWEVRPSYWRRRHLDTPLPRSKRQESRRLDYNYGKRLTYGSPPVSPMTEKKWREGSAADENPLFAQVHETPQPWRKWFPNTPQDRRIDRYDTPTQYPGRGSPSPFLPSSRHATPMLSKTKKQRVVSSASLIHDGPRPTKKNRTRAELRDGTVSPPRLLSTPNHANTDTSLFGATPSKLLEDIFAGVTAYIDTRVPTELGVKGLFTNFGGRLASLKDADYVVLHATPGGGLSSSEECALAVEAIARGAHVVSAEWINESVLTDKLAPVDEFTVRPGAAYKIEQHPHEREVRATLGDIREDWPPENSTGDQSTADLVFNDAPDCNDTPMLNYASDGDEPQNVKVESDKRHAKRKRALSDVEPEDLDGVKRRALNFTTSSLEMSGPLPPLGDLTGDGVAATELE